MNRCLAENRELSNRLINVAFQDEDDMFDAAFGVGKLPTPRPASQGLSAKDVEKRQLEMAEQVTHCSSLSRSCCRHSQFLAVCDSDPQHVLSFGKHYDTDIRRHLVWQGPLSGNATFGFGPGMPVDLRQIRTMTVFGCRVRLVSSFLRDGVVADEVG